MHMYDYYLKIITLRNSKMIDPGAQTPNIEGQHAEGLQLNCFWIHRSLSAEKKFTLYQKFLNGKIE